MDIKIPFYLDPLTRDTGALRVIPGSHRVGEPYADTIERDIRESGKIWGMSVLMSGTRFGDISRRYCRLQSKPQARCVWGF